MEEMFKMKNLADALMQEAESFINRQKSIKNRQVKVTGIHVKGGLIISGWFVDVNKGEEYAAAMTARGYVVVKQYR